VLEKRNSQRIKTVLPVKVSTDEATSLVHTVDITATGAQLGGLRTQLRSGMIVSLQRGSHKAKFRIAWVRRLGPKELRAGIECLEPQNNFWEVGLTDGDHEAKDDMRAMMTLLSDCTKSVM
jgi:hypothetical protein